MNGSSGERYDTMNGQYDKHSSETRSQIRWFKVDNIAINKAMKSGTITIDSSPNSANQLLMLEICLMGTYWHTGTVQHAACEDSN